MRILQSVFFALISFSVFSQDITILRKEFVEAASSKENSEQFINTTAKITSASKPNLMAYRGAALIIQGKYLPKLEDKKKSIKEGVALLDGAVSKDPRNIEVRAIRMGVQENTPKIVKYRGNIAEDKAFILKNYSDISSAQLKTFVEGYIQHSKSFSAEEKKGL
jgi:hypothetical protein